MRGHCPGWDWDAISKERGLFRFSEGDWEGVAWGIGGAPGVCHFGTRGTMGVIRC